MCLSRKPYKRGERTEARINLRIQIDLVGTWNVLEMTMKLVNRIILAMPHIVRATIMRMIICFMIFLFHQATSKGPKPPLLICVI